MAEKTQEPKIIQIAFSQSAILVGSLYGLDEDGNVWISTKAFPESQLFQKQPQWRKLIPNERKRRTK